MQNLDFVGPHNYQELTGEVAEQKRAELQMKNSEFSTKNQILTVIFSISFILLLFTFIWHITAALQPGEIEIFDNI